MQKILKYIIVTLLSLSLAWLLFYIAFTYYISSASLRQNLSNRLSIATGYRVELHQPPHISFFPKLKASFNYVILKNKDIDFLKTDKLEISFSFWQALKGIMVVSDIKLIKPHFFLYSAINDFPPLMQHSFSLHTISIKDGLLDYSPGKQVKNLNGWLKFGPKRSYLNLSGQLLNKPINFVSDSAYRNNSLQLYNINAQIGRQEIHGALQIFNKPTIKLVGSLALNEINLKTYIYYLLDNIIANLDIRISADKAYYEGFQLKKLAATIQTDNKNLIFTLGDAKAIGGQISAVCNIVKNHNLKLQMLLKNINPAELKLPIEFKDKLTINIELNQFINLKQLKQRVLHDDLQNLTFKIKLANAKIASYNIKTILKIAASYTKNLGKFIEIPAPYESLIVKRNKNYIYFKNAILTFNFNKLAVKLNATANFDKVKHLFSLVKTPANVMLHGIMHGENPINYWFINGHFIAMRQTHNLYSNKLLYDLLNKYKVN